MTSLFRLPLTFLSDGIFCFMIFLSLSFIPSQTTAYTFYTLHSTLQKSSLGDDLFLEPSLVIPKAGKTWTVLEQNPSQTEVVKKLGPVGHGKNLEPSPSFSSWTLKHHKMAEPFYLLKTSFQLKDLTNKSQTLLKEYGVLGFEILSSQWVKDPHLNKKVLKLELKHSKSQELLNQFLFELPSEEKILKKDITQDEKPHQRQREPLFVLHCPQQNPSLCLYVVQSLTKGTVSR
jgi:hypothetical protein